MFKTSRTSSTSSITDCLETYPGLAERGLSGAGCGIVLCKTLVSLRRRKSSKTPQKSQAGPAARHYSPASGGPAAPFCDVAPFAPCARFCTSFPFSRASPPRSSALLLDTKALCSEQFLFTKSVQEQRVAAFRVSLVSKSRPRAAPPTHLGRDSIHPQGIASVCTPQRQVGN